MDDDRAGDEEQADGRDRLEAGAGEAFAEEHRCEYAERPDGARPARVVEPVGCRPHYGQPEAADELSAHTDGQEDVHDEGTQMCLPRKRAKMSPLTHVTAAQTTATPK